jgi:hypothetical protein
MAHAGWLERHGAESWDPYDLLATRAGIAAKSLYYRRPRIGGLAAAPFIVADLLAPRISRVLIAPKRYPISDAHYALGFGALALGSGERRWMRPLVGFLEALVGQRCPDEADYCWGYPFDWATCFGVWPAGTPLITSTPYAYEAFEVGARMTGSHECLGIMESTAAFAYARIPAVEVSPGLKASAYTPVDARRVVNASSYRAFLLSTAGVRFGRPEWLEEASANVAWVISVQARDGSWDYAMDGRDQFVDNIHTCFVLKNLAKYQAATGDDRAAAALARGYGFYKDALLDGTGQPVPFARAPRVTLRRRDLYDYAEGIELALLLEGADADAAAIADTLTRAVLDGWLLPDGSFVTAETIIGPSTVPYVRWAQAQTFHALADYVLARGG